MEINEITKRIIGCAIEVHKQLGPGLLESAYEECLFYELVNAGMDVKKQVAFPLVYKEIKLDAGYRIDLLVNDNVIVEIKSVDALAEIHKAQLMTYMKLTVTPKVNVTFFTTGKCHIQFPFSPWVVFKTCL